MQKIKILIVVSNLEYGGAQRQIIELVNNINTSRYKVDIASLSDYVPLASQLTSTETIVHIVHKQNKFDFSVVFKLMKLIKSEGYEILHSYLFDAEIASRLAARLSTSHPKVIGSERNTNYSIKKIQRSAYKLTRKMFEIIIANSRSGADFNARELNISREKYRVIYNGVNTKKFKPRPKTNLRRKLNVADDAVLIGVFASFKAQKNHEFLFDTLLEIDDLPSNVRILLVGDMLFGGMHGSDEYYDGILKRINETSLAPRCIFLGNRDDVEMLYPACNFTVLPSRFEGTPNVILESMACGIPVIATNVSDNARIIEDEVSGLLVELDNKGELKVALSKLMRDTSLVSTMGLASRESIIEKFSSEMLAVNTSRVYDELTSE